MAPKVQVPCDFGREYINVPEHCNLTLKLQNGEAYLVNSVLMSYNSPEIKRLTTELHQTSLAMDDFDEKAVYCFVDALYTGEIIMLDRDVFTDVYKMAHVFEVSWLLNRLSDFFESLVKCRIIVRSSSNYDVFKKVKSLFEVASVVLSQGSKKQRMFMDIFINSLTEKGDKSEFVKRYMGEVNFNELSKSMAEQILQMVGDESDLLVDGLVKSLRKHVFDKSLSNELKYLLKECNLTACYQKRRELFNELFDVLDGIESLTRDDLRFLHRISRQSMNELPNPFGGDQNFSNSTGSESFSREQSTTEVDGLKTDMDSLTSSSCSASQTVATNGAKSVDQDLIKEFDPLNVSDPNVIPHKNTDVTALDNTSIGSSNNVPAASGGKFTFGRGKLKTAGQPISSPTEISEGYRPPRIPRRQPQASSYRQYVAGRPPVTSSSISRRPQRSDETVNHRYRIWPGRDR